MNRNGKGPQGPPPQSYHHNGNGNENNNNYSHGPVNGNGNGVNRPHQNQYPHGYPAYHQGHGTDQQLNEPTGTVAASSAPLVAPLVGLPSQQAQAPLTYFEKCTQRTRTIAHYKRIEQIGEGTYGQVYKAKCLSSNRIVALKKIRLTSVATEGLPRTVIREIKILKALKHENMVQMLEVVSSKGCEYLDEEDEHKEDKKRRLLTDEANNIKGEKESSKDKNNNNDTLTEREKYKGNLFLVLEYISHDLSGILDMGIRFDPVQSKYIFRQLLSVLDYMHEQRYVHRDLKSSNILIDQRYKVKLADFGLARSIDDGFDWQSDQKERKERKLTNKVVTIWYRSPELLLGATDYDEKVDIWSAGCILAELLLGKALFPGTNDVEQLRLIFKLMGTPSEGNWEGLKSYPKVKSKDVEIGKPIKAEFRDKYAADDRFVSSPSSLALIERLLELDPKKRWRAKQALESQYFRSKPTLPSNPDTLGTIPITGDSHEFQTKPIRKQAKIVAQKASADAKKRGENEKEAYERAYKDFLAKAAETGTFEVSVPVDDKEKKHKDRDRDKDRNQDRDKDREKDRDRERDRESDKEKKRRRREKDDIKDKRDRDHDRARREKDEQREKRHKRDKDNGDEHKKDRDRRDKEGEESSEKRDRRNNKEKDRSRRDREKDLDKGQRDRDNSKERSNDRMKPDDNDKSGKKGKRSDEKKESRSTEDAEVQPSEEKILKRASRSRSRDRDNKDGKRSKRDSHESSRERRERKDRDRSRERKERRDKDRSRHRDRRDKDEDRRNRDKDRKEKSSDSRKDKDRRDKDRRRSGGDRAHSGSRERSRRSKDRHERDRNRRHDDERRRDDWGRQGRGRDNRDHARRDQYPPTKEWDRPRDGPPGWDSRDGPRYRDDRPSRR